MSTNQGWTGRAIVSIAAAAVALQVLIVPWRPRLEGTLLEGFAGGAGYRPIWAGDGSSIDVVRLVVQLAVTIVAAAVVFGVATRRS
jgi:hypothetical protein